MGSLGSRYLPSRAWLRYARDKKPARGAALKIAWGVFLVVGLPLGLMAVLGPLERSGIFIEPLRQFWRPWPPDWMKGVIGVTGFAATLAYLCYRSGRNRGYRSGRIAGKAAKLNAEEATAAAREELPAPLPEPARAVQATSVLPDAPVPPHQ